MKALFLKPGTSNMHFKEIEEPTIQSPTQVKIQVLSVGICGTDREEVSGGRADAPKGEKELIIGHEMLGKIVEVGSKVSNFSPHELVVVSVRRGCKECIACGNNRSDFCLTGKYKEHGIKELHGFHAEYVVDEEQFLIKVPAQLKEIGVLTEPMSVVQKAIEEAENIQKSRLVYEKKEESFFSGKKVLVAGLGPIGLLAALVLRLKGAEVLGLDVVDPTSPRVKLLQKIGGVYFNDRTVDPRQFCQKHPDIALILDAAGIAKLDFDLISLLGINGILVLTGVPGEERPINLNGAELMRNLVLKNQLVLGSVNESITHFQKGVEYFSKAEKLFPGFSRSLVTQRFSIREWEKAFSHHDPEDIKVVIDWS